MNPILFLIFGAGAGSVVGGGPAWFYIRAQNRRVASSADHEDAETDSVIVDTARNVVAIVRGELNSLANEIISLKAENQNLLKDHRKCNEDLRGMHVEVTRERMLRERNDQQIEQLLVEANNAREVRVRQAEQIDELTSQVATLQARPCD